MSTSSFTHRRGAPEAAAPATGAVEGRDAHDERVGTEIGKYVVTRRLGRGGMGVVYEAWDKVLRRPVAIKFFAEAAAVTSESVRRFVLEAQAAARLSHPNVVSVYEVGRRDGTYFLVMERVPGVSAEDHIQLRGKFEWREATEIAAAACRGLAAAHAASLIHRDVKPANLLLCEDRTTAAGPRRKWHVKVSDFGLAKLMDGAASMATAADRVLGTPHYMSPEQCRAEALDPRSDLYSLGATYYSLLTGRAPFGGDLPVQVMFAHCWSAAPDPRELGPEIPDACAAVVNRAMAKDPRDRYRSAGEMVAALEDAIVLSSGPSAGASKAAQSPDAAPGNRWAEPDENARRDGAPGAVFASRAFDPVNSVPPAAPHAPVDRSGSRRRLRPVIAACILTAAGVAGVLRLSFRGQAPARPGLDSPAEASAGVAPVPASAPAVPPLRLTESRWTLDAGGSVSTVAFSPDGRRLAATVSDGLGGIRGWDPADGRQLCSTWLNKFFRGAAFPFDPQGRTLYAGQGSSVVQWSFVQETRRNFPLPVEGEIRSLAWAPDGRTLAVVVKPPGAGGRASVKLFDREDKPVHCPSDPHDVLAACFLGRHGLMATGGTDAVLRLYYVGTAAGGTSLVRSIDAEVAITSLASSQDGKVIAVGGRQSVQFFDASGVRRARAFRPDHNVRSLALSPDGALAAVGSGDGATGEVTLFDAATGAMVAGLFGHRSAVSTVAFSPDGNSLATGSTDQAVRVWNLEAILSSHRRAGR